MSAGSIVRSSFGATPDGREIDLFTLHNGRGMEAQIITFGGRVRTLSVPDRDGRCGDIVLGYDSLEAYLSDASYFGALVGRYANRIANGQFKLNGKTHRLSVNDGENSLHGGATGFDKAIWSVAAAEVREAGPLLGLTYLSLDGEEGYPGNMLVQATYTLTQDNALRVDLSAQSDADSVVNLTHHSYFNLRGHGDVLDHRLKIFADRFTPIDASLIPTGEIADVTGTAFDFRVPTAIGSRIDADDAQLRFAGGYDHNWIIGKTGDLKPAAAVYERKSGRMLEVQCTAPGMQFYSGNFLDGFTVGKRNEQYKYRGGFCLEPQHYPDAPNQPNFPSAVLRRGERYENSIVYRFSVRR